MFKKYECTYSNKYGTYGGVGIFSKRGYKKLLKNWDNVKVIRIF